MEQIGIPLSSPTVFLQLGDPKRTVGITPGGSEGQVFTKLSNRDYDAGWADPEVSTGGDGSGGAQVQSDWNETNTVRPSFIKNKPDIAAITKNLDGAQTITLPDTVPTLSRRRFADTAIHELDIDNLYPPKLSWTANKTVVVDSLGTQGIIIGNSNNYYHILTTSSLEYTYTIITEQQITYTLGGKLLFKPDNQKDKIYENGTLFEFAEKFSANAQVGDYVYLNTPEKSLFTGRVTRTTGAGGDLEIIVELVTFPDLSQKKQVYVTANTSDPNSGTGAFNDPYGSLSYAISESAGKSHIVFNLEKGVMFEEDIVIDGADDWFITSFGTLITPGAKIRSVNITGATRDFVLRSVDVYENMTIDNLNQEIHFSLQHCQMSGEIMMNLCCDDTEVEIFKCKFFGKNTFTISGNGAGNVVFSECEWDYDGNGAVVIDAPKSFITFSSCLDVSVHRKQGGVDIDGATYLVPSDLIDSNYSFVSDATPGYSFFSGGSTIDYNGKIQPIKLNGTAEYKLGTGFEFLVRTSILNGKFIEGGVTSLQIRDVNTRPGYTPRLGGLHIDRDRAITLNDHFYGISDALVAAKSIDIDDKGIKTTAIIDSTSGTVTGGLKFGLENVSTNSVVHIKDKEGNDWLKLDVSSASSGILGVATVDGPTSPYDETAAYSPGTSVHYQSRAYVATQNIQAPAGIFDQSKWTVAPDSYVVGNGYPAWNGFVMCSGFYYVSELNQVLSQAVIDQMNAVTDADSPEPDGWFRFKNMPVAGKYVVFFLSNRKNGFLSVLDLNQFVGGPAISIDPSGYISIILDPISGLTKRPGVGLGFDDDHTAMRMTERAKLTDLPEKNELDAKFSAKIDSVSGMGLSQNSYTTTEKAKLTALPENATLTANLDTATNSTLTDAAGAVTLPATTKATNSILLQTVRNCLKAIFSWFPSNVLGVENGGTGSSTKNFVDVSSAQTVAGTKTFSASPVIPNHNLPFSSSQQGVSMADLLGYLGQGNGNQVAGWDNTNKKWVPQTAPTSGVSGLLISSNLAIGSWNTWGEQFTTSTIGGITSFDVTDSAAPWGSTRGIGTLIEFKHLFVNNNHRTQICILQYIPSNYQNMKVWIRQTNASGSSGWSAWKVWLA